jgi:hypothetical protein
MQGLNGEIRKARSRREFGQRKRRHFFWTASENWREGREFSEREWTDSFC